MANINWNAPFYVDPVTLEATTDPTGAIPIPSYGVFGGPFSPDPDSAQPLDPLDAVFRVHDIESNAATTPAEQGQADQHLVDSILDLSLRQIDPEAALYGGAAALFFVQELEADPNDGVDLTPWEYGHATLEALDDIGWGLRHLSGGELAQAQAYLEQAAAVGVDIGLDAVADNRLALPHVFDLLI